MGKMTLKTSRHKKLLYTTYCLKIVTKVLISNMHSDILTNFTHINRAVYIVRKIQKRFGEF